MRTADWTPVRRVDAVEVGGDLGAHRSTHRGRYRASVWFVLALPVFFFVAPVACGGVNAEVIAILLLVDGLFATFAGWLGWTEYRNSGDRVDLYERGLVHHDRHGVVRTYPWTGIDRVREQTVQASAVQIPVRTVHFVELRRTDGAKVVLNNRFRGAAGLGETVAKEASWAILARASDGLHAGEPQEFDGTVLDLHGIRRGRRQVPWPDVRDITVFNGTVYGKIRIRRKSRRATTWRVFPAPIWSNLRVLLALAESRMARHQS